MIKKFAGFRLFERLKVEGSLVVLFFKIVFLLFVGVYVLTLPAYYFVVLHMMGDALMPFEVVLCCVSSFVSFVWVFRMVFQLNREMRRGSSGKLC